MGGFRAIEKVVVVAGLATFDAQAATIQRGPLSCSDIEFLLVGKVNPKRIVELIAERQNRCQATEEALNTLKKAGANTDLLAALERGRIATDVAKAAQKPATNLPEPREERPPRTKPRTVPPVPPTQAVKTLNVQVWTNKGENAVYSEGETIVINVRVSRSSYVHVYYTDASRQIYRIYPNAKHPEVRIPAGSVLTIPTPSDDFQIEVTPPFGAESISVLASEKSLKTLSESGSPAGPYLLVSAVPAAGRDMVKRQIAVRTRARSK